MSMSIKIKHVFYLSFILLTLSTLLPWWEYNTYSVDANRLESTQKLQILPPVFRIDSTRNVVIREIPVQGDLKTLSYILLSLCLTSIILNSYGLIIFDYHTQATKKIYLFSGIITLFGCLFFLYTYNHWLSQPIFNNSLFGSANENILPVGYTTRWGLSYGFLFSMISGVLSLFSSQLSSFK